MIRPIVIQQPVERIIEHERIIPPPVQSPIRQTDPIIQVVPIVEREVVHIHHHPASVEQVRTSPEKEQKEFVQPTKNNSDPEAETIPNNSPKGNDSEFFPNSLKPVESKPEAKAEDVTPPPVQAYKKKGKVVGRQRKYEQLGNKGERPIKELILYREHTKKHWPGMSADMVAHYEFYYFTKPSKAKDKADYEHHRKCYERGRKWIADDTVTSTGANKLTAPLDAGTATITPFRKRTASN